MRMRLIAVGVFLFLMLATKALLASVMPVYMLRDVATKSSALVVGRVMSTEVVGKVAQSNPRWSVPTLRMRAKVNVLRAHSQVGSPCPTPGAEISVDYLAVDNEALDKPTMSGAFFPKLSPSNILLLPLSGVDENGNWSFFDEQAGNALLPCVDKGVDDTPADSNLAFMEREVAGVYISGSPSDMIKVSQNYVLFWSITSAKPIADILKKHVKDKERWLDIGVAIYTCMPLESTAATPDSDSSRRPKIVSILGNSEVHDVTRSYLARTAFKQAGDADLDARVIKASIDEMMGVYPWGVGITLKTNYPSNPLVTKLLGEALMKDRPGAIDVAAMALQKATDPLVPAAVASATRTIAKSTDFGVEREFGTLRSACSIITQFGTASSRAALLAEMRRTQKSDREKYRALWRACGYDASPMATDIARIYIEDNSVAFTSNDGRAVTYADAAASSLAVAAKVDFGGRSAKTREDMDKVVERAKQWLAKRP